MGRNSFLNDIKDEFLTYFNNIQKKGKWKHDCKYSVMTNFSILRSIKSINKSPKKKGTQNELKTKIKIINHKMVKL